MSKRRSKIKKVPLFLQSFAAVGWMYLLFNYYWTSSSTMFDPAVDYDSVGLPVTRRQRQNHQHHLLLQEHEELLRQQQQSLLRQQQFLGEQSKQEQQHQQQQEVRDSSSSFRERKRRVSLLMGIFTTDTGMDRTIRNRQRTLFKIWNDPRVCTLHELQTMPEEDRYHCELIFTFVLGANPNGPTEIVNKSVPILAKRPILSNGHDLNDDDITQLNIKENMNEGKSQTWFYYASQVMEEYGLDYVAKCDGDTAIHLHEFFVFAYRNLVKPTALPVNNLFAGALRDKAGWPEKETKAEQYQYERFFETTYEGVHLYLAGQFYIMSLNLAKLVALEAPHSREYAEGHEDHDIATMIFHVPEPVQLVTIGRQQRCWEHPVKGETRWKRIHAREGARMSGELFEGKLLPKDSSYEEVVLKEESLLIPTHKHKMQQKG